jgi:hypothetical protein
VKGDGFDTKNVTTRRFTGPRTMMALIGAHAASGQIWDMKPQYLNSQYSISFSGPTVKCEDADDVTSSLIEQKRQAKRRSQPVEGAIIVDDAYYAFVPHLDEQNNLKALDTPIYQEPSSRSRNELWMTFYRYYVDDEGFLRKRRYYQVCRLHNATYTIDLEWENGIQITRGDVEAHKPVEYPHDPRGTESNMAQHAYSAFFWALTDHLVGWLGYYQHPDCEVTIPEDLNCAKKFGVMATPIGRTALIGSDDLDVFFDFNEEKDEKGFLTREPSEQRKQDKMRANSTTLDVLIPRFAFNMTASILFNPLLT